MYDKRFFDVIRGGIQRSASALVPKLFEMFEPATVIDVGCGEGWWAAAFAEQGAQVIGIDGPETQTVLGDQYFVPHDLRKPFVGVIHQADLVVCLEVAEHLPSSRASSFVSWLCDMAPVVVFSAAIPGQGGTGHVNEQWPDYWADLFHEHSYSVSGELRLDIWNDDRIENWYRQNLLVCVDLERRPQFEPLFKWEMPLPLVHPVLYEARRH